jgi:asparagine synthase (glutamine-hydrolysing)
MANSREVRLPFLFHELVEFVFTLPDDLKIRNGWTKWILRKTFENMLPREIVWRKEKIGYEPPLNSWIRNQQFQKRIALSKTSLLDHHILSEKLNGKELNPLLQWRIYVTEKSLFS